MLTPWAVQQEYARGRGEVIAFTILGNLFFGWWVAVLLSEWLTHSSYMAIPMIIGLVAGPILRNRSKRKLRAATLGLNAAYRSIALGKLNDAEALLDSVEAVTRANWAQRLTLVQRAIIGLRRGDLRSARASLDIALELKDDGRFKTNSGYQIEGAHAMRAFVHAGLGDAENAALDIAWVRSRPRPSPEALARVAVAEAICLERAGDRDGLRDLLERERTLVLEHTHPRERAIVRAFQRMLKVQQRSVYRERAEVDAGGEEPAIDDWVAKIAPAAAQFVRKGQKPGPKPGQDAQQAYQAYQYQQQQMAFAQQNVARVAANQFRSGVVAGSPARNMSSSRQRNWLIGLGIAGVVALIVALVKLGDNVGTPAVPNLNVPGSLEPGSIAGPLFALGFGALALGVASFAMVKRAYRRKLQREQLAPVGGASAPVQTVDARVAQVVGPDMSAVTEGPDDVLAAQGHMMVAAAAEKRGEWPMVLEHCDKAIARLWSPESRTKADILYPDLHSLRAFALACLGRYADAEAALRWVGPTYPHLERAVFRVRLIEYLHVNGPREAAGLADAEAHELPLSVREELLADLARAVSSPETAGPGEAARLREEIDRTENAKAWIGSISPALLRAFFGQEEQDLSSFGAPQERLRIAPVEQEKSQAIREQEEAEAELEAELSGKPPAWVSPPR